MDTNTFENTAVVDSPSTTSQHFAFCEKHHHAPNSFYCPNCGKYYCDECISIRSQEKKYFCYCTAPLVPVSMLPPLRRKSIAVFLALVFGSVGLHHFYTGHTAAGVFHLLFSLLFVGLSTTPLHIVSVIYFIIIGIACIIQAFRYSSITDVYGRPLI